jgi:hypothetical protein
VTSQIEHGDDVMSTVDVLWVVALAFPDGGGVFFLCRVLSFIFYWFGMVRRQLTIPERWQAVGMHNGGFRHRRVADHFRVNHSIIVRPNLQSMYHPERRDHDVAKMGFKTGAGKT